MQLTIEITEEQHRYIENSAKYEGKTMEDYVLGKAMSDSFEILEEDGDIRELLEFLKLRIESAKRENIVKVNTTLLNSELHGKALKLDTSRLYLNLNCESAIFYCDPLMDVKVSTVSLET